MTIRLYETHMSQRSTLAIVQRVDAVENNFGQFHAIVLDQTVAYAMGGGQPGDSGTLTWADGRVGFGTTVKGEGADILHLVPVDQAAPAVGERVEVQLDWERRHKLMRMHTALHLLCATIDAPVTGGSIGEERGRLDFDLAESPDKEAVEQALNAAVEADYAVEIGAITEAELDANPDLVRTMSVKPPRNGGAIRMVRIGTPDQAFDYQPCGGTHVSSTAEIGQLRLGKVEKKGKQNRRVSIHFA